MIFDDPTGMEDCVKQEALDLIRFNIEQMLKYGTNNRIVDEKVKHITTRDIDHYLQKLQKDQSFIEDLRIRNVQINDIELFARICDYTNTYQVNYPQKNTPKIYFIESEDFAITFIPMELDTEEVNIYMEPLDSSLDFILEKFQNLNPEKTIRDIHFVRAEDLKSSPKT